MVWTTTTKEEQYAVHQTIGQGGCRIFISSSKFNIIFKQNRNENVRKSDFISYLSHIRLQTGNRILFVMYVYLHNNKFSFSHQSILI